MKCIPKILLRVNWKKQKGIFAELKDRYEEALKN
jgi:hypothetical protein